MTVIDTLRDSSIPILVVTALCSGLLFAANASLETQGTQPMTITTSSATDLDTSDLSAAEIQSRARTAAEPLEPFRKGRAAYQDRRYEAAQTHLRQAAKQRPDNPMITNYQGLTARELGQDDIAADRWTDILERHPTYEAAHLNLGVLFAQQGQPDRALHHYNQVLASNPNHARAHFNLGLLNRQMDQQEAALRHLARARGLSSGSLKAKAAYYQGRVLLATDQPEAARGAFQEAIELEPDYVEARLALADALPDDPAHRDRRLRLYRQVARLDPQAVNSQTVAGRLGILQPPQGETLFPELLSLEPFVLLEGPEDKVQLSTSLEPTAE